MHCFFDECMFFTRIVTITKWKVLTDAKLSKILLDIKQLKLGFMFSGLAFQLKTPECLIRSSSRSFCSASIAAALCLSKVSTSVAYKRHYSLLWKSNSTLHYHVVKFWKACIYVYRKKKKWGRLELLQMRTSKEMWFDATTACWLCEGPWEPGTHVSWWGKFYVKPP